MSKKLNFYGVDLLRGVMQVIGLMGLIGLIGLTESTFAINTASADAVSLSIGLSSSYVTVHQPIKIDVNISGLGEDPAALSLGAFDLNLNFDSSILRFDGYDFGDEDNLNFSEPTDPDLLKIWNDGTYRGVISSGSGTVNLWEVSLDTPEDLISLQPSSFTLATLTFSSIGSGLSSFSWDLDPSCGILNEEGNSIPDNVAVFTTTGATVTITRVPVSSSFISILLLVMGIIGIAGVQGKCSQRGKLALKKNLNIELKKSNIIGY
jgi:hypothetical protein